MSSTALTYFPENLPEHLRENARPRNTLVSELKGRYLRRGLSEVSCLFITCDEEIGLSKSPHESRIPDSLALGTPGASVDDPELVEAIEYAVQQLGVRRVIVAAHSLCDHLAEASEIAWPAAATGNGWLEQRINRANALMQAARDEVRAGVEALSNHPSIISLGVPISGVVRAVESDVYYFYYRDRDEFEVQL